MLKYTEVLKMAKDKVNEAMAPLRAREQRKRGELEIATLESQLAEEQQKVVELAAKYPIDYKKLTDALDERDLVERRLDQLKEVLTKLFDEEK